MAISFPAFPPPKKATPFYRDFSGVLTPPTGGEEQRISRIGDRWQMSFVMPPMDEATALAWIAVQTRARTEGQTVRMAMPRKGPAPEVVAATGTVNTAAISANATGSTTLILVGMFFSFETAGRAYLHQVTTIAGGVLGVAPRLRAPVAGALNFVAPVIEGLLITDTTWDIEKIAHSGLDFAIAESR